MYDYSALRGRIREMIGTETAFHQKMGWSLATGTKKLNGRSLWSQDEMVHALVILKAKPSANNLATYFFNLKV